MALKIKRFVTDRTVDGKSVFVGLDDPRRAPAGGMDITNVWGTADGTPAVTSGGTADPVLFPFFPGPGGTRLCIVEFPPQSASDGHGTDNTDPEETQPGLVGAFEAENPGMHTTDSVDYGICLSGELYLELDDGAEQHITPGTLVVQQGTRHAWRNRGTEVCTMVFVLVGAERV